MQKEKGVSDVDTPELAQPLCTALQIALLNLLASWNIFPKAVTGHSSGEITAAYCAGGLSHASALKVAFYRGALAARLRKHNPNPRAMASVAMAQELIHPHLLEVTAHLRRGRIAVGCVNSPNNVTVTGDLESVDTLVKCMEAKGVFARKLQVDVAYHSTYMEEIADEYSALLRELRSADGLSTSSQSREATAIFSSVTGTRLAPCEYTEVKYWVANLVSKVVFSDALADMNAYLLNQRTSRKSGKDIVIEIGPHAALQRPVKDTINENAQFKDICYDSILQRGVSGLESCLKLVGRLHCSGYRVDFTSIRSAKSQHPEPQLLSDLPQYSFNHSQSYWVESRISRNFRFRKQPRHELLGTPSADWNASEPQWRNVIRSTENPWIVDHQVSFNDNNERKLTYV